jgi:hypothetical protein
MAAQLHGKRRAAHERIYGIDRRAKQPTISVWCSLESTGVAKGSGLWETVGMATKRTKADKAQRQADQLEKKARHPASKRKKRPREDFSQAAARIVRKATENH